MKTLYKIDTKGKIREWRMEVDGNKYRSIAGIQGGKLVTSEWTIAYAKNEGRANATTPEEQALLEVQSHYTKKLDGEYKESIDDVGKLTFFKPMLASKWENRKSKMTYPAFIQPKLDGVRCIISKDGAKTRAGKPINSIPHVLEDLKALFENDPNIVLDGELYNHELKDDFNEIISIVRKEKATAESLQKSKEMAQYHIYDIPSSGDAFGGRSLDLEFLFDTYIGGSSCKFVRTDFVANEEQINEMYGQYMLDGYEGAMVRLDKPYEQKRSNTLMKMKEFEDAEFEIISVEEGQGNWSGYAKRIVFKLEDGRECGAGLKGNQAYAKELLEQADEYVGGQVTVQFFTRTPDGVPRFPVAKALFKNKRDL